MSEKLEQLKSLLAEVADLEHVQELLGWDQQTYMPQGAAESRGNQLATLGKLSHQKFTSDEIGTLLGDLEKEFEGADPDLDEVRLLKVTRHEYERSDESTVGICNRVCVGNQQSLRCLAGSPEEVGFLHFPTTFGKSGGTEPALRHVFSTSRPSV